MAFPGDSEVSLLLHLHDAVFTGGEWGDFLSRLAVICRANLAAMIVRMPGVEQPTIVASATPVTPDAAVDPAALGIVMNAWMRPERIYSGSELDDLAVGGSPSAAVTALGMTSVRAMRVGVSDAMSLVIGVFRTREFEAADGAVLRRLYPYLQVAARAAARVRRERGRAEVGAMLARGAGAGWFLLDRAGLVIDAEPGRVKLPSGVRILGVPQGDRLVLVDRGAAAALAAMLDRIATGAPAPRRAVRVSEDPACHLRVSAWQAPADPWNKPAIALAVLQCGLPLAPDAADLMVDLFGLLPSEARLAAALAGGETLAGAARRLGLTIETARNYSKKVFAKTGTAGQADLVRLIYASGFAGSAG